MQFQLFFNVLSDDRFILKQMPKLEVQSFLDFAPNYFTYITGAVQQKVRSNQSGKHKSTKALLPRLS